MSRSDPPIGVAVGEREIIDALPRAVVSPTPRVASCAGTPPPRM